MDNKSGDLVHGKQRNGRGARSRTTSGIITWWGGLGEEGWVRRGGVG